MRCADPRDWEVFFRSPYPAVLASLHGIGLAEAGPLLAMEVSMKRKAPARPS
jgi:hypothetical protein